MYEEKVRKYVEAFQKLDEKGVNLRAFYLENLSAIIGQAGTTAIIFHIGENALLNPSSFVRQLIQIFGNGGFVFLDRMMSQIAVVESSKKCVSAKRR